LQRNKLEKGTYIQQVDWECAIWPIKTIAGQSNAQLRENR
jgi:hypothetical protein